MTPNQKKAREIAAVASPCYWPSFASISVEPVLDCATKGRVFDSEQPLNEACGGCYRARKITPTIQAALDEKDQHYQQLVREAQNGSEGCLRAVKSMKIEIDAIWAALGEPPGPPMSGTGKISAKVAKMRERAERAEAALAALKETT